MKSTEKLEKSNTDGGVEKTSNKGLNYEMIKRTEIKDTPFTVITTEEGSFLTMGKYRLTEAYKTEEEGMDEGEKITWNRIVQVTMLLWEQLNNEPIKTNK